MHTETEKEGLIKKRRTGDCEGRSREKTEEERKEKKRIRGILLY